MPRIAALMVPCVSDHACAGTLVHGCEATLTHCIVVLSLLQGANPPSVKDVVCKQHTSDFCIVSGARQSIYITHPS